MASPGKGKPPRRRPGSTSKRAIPALEHISPPARRKSGGAYETHVLGGEEKTSRARPEGLSKAVQSEEQRVRSPGIDQAIELSRDGDDSVLLPYQPTPSINPSRPRTLAAGYDPATQTLRIRFRDGTPWQYFDVPPRVWRNFTRVKSPGRFVNRVLNQYPYAKGDF